MTYSGGDLSVAKVEEGLKVLLKEVKDENAKRETLKKEMAAMNGQNVMEGWPTLDTQKPMTVSYDIDKSVHHVIEGKLADVNKRLNYGKNEVAAYDPATKQLIGDTFLCIPAKFDASTVITMTGPSHKVKAGVSTFNSFLSHFKIIGNVRKVTRSDQAPKPKPKVCPLCNFLPSLYIISHFFNNPTGQENRTREKTPRTKRSRFWQDQNTTEAGPGTGHHRGPFHAVWTRRGA